MCVFFYINAIYNLCRTCSLLCGWAWQRAAISRGTKCCASPQLDQHSGRAVRQYWLFFFISFVLFYIFAYFFPCMLIFLKFCVGLTFLKIFFNNFFFLIFLVFLYTNYSNNRLISFSLHFYARSR